MTLDELRGWMESTELREKSPVIADVDGLKLPLERIEVRNGRMIIFVDMYNGRDYEAESAWRKENREKKNDDSAV
jgi:hypothetical protein